MKRIVILSGKGGVGKSSLAASLAIAISRHKKVVCADCDVDAPNLALVLGLRQKNFKEWKPISTNEKPVLEQEKCNGCKQCLGECYFNAISWDERKRQPVFDYVSCEGCGVCSIVCPKSAIRLESVENAKIGFGKTRHGFDVVSGQLEIGETGSGKIVAEVKRKAEEIGRKADIMLIDSAAGIGCPVIASVMGSEYAIAVTEPTPSALSDLKRAVAVVEHFRIPLGIVINKHDLNLRFTEKIERFAKQSKHKILAKIPYEKGFVDALLNLTPIIVFKPETKAFFDKIIKEAQIVEKSQSKKKSF